MSISAKTARAVINAINYYFIAVDDGYDSLAETLAEIIDTWLEKNKYRLPSSYKSGIINADFNESDVERDELGRFAETTKYKPSKQRNHSGIQVAYKKYAKLAGDFKTRYPNAKPEDGSKIIRDGNYSYVVQADGYGGIIIKKRTKLK